MVDTVVPPTTSKKVYFYCTGYGKFGNVLENPTSILVRDLPDLLSAQAASPRGN